RRRRWSEVSLDVSPSDSFSFNPRMLISTHESPESRAMKSSLLTELATAIRTSLTDYQRKVLMAALNAQMPMGEVARHFDTNRNALYQVLHDARMKLKQALLEAGISADDVHSLS
ncbi:MAG TPA: hypothetical protein VMW69_17030, partial [Spirochaetia bacterium]|nr:hypothetical protein [Spirochaetia bacterium]